MLTKNEIDSPDGGQTYDLVLSSGSPRRRDILNQIGVRYIVVVPEIDESPPPTLISKTEISVIIFPPILIML